MSEIADRYATIADGFGARVAGVPPGGWRASSPCTEWTASDVVVHVIGVHDRVLAGLEGTDAPEVSSDEDLAARWASSTRAVRDALADERAARIVRGGPFGEQPFESLVGRVVCADTLVHTWDLARATGQDERLDRDAVTRAAEFLVPLDDGLRRPGAFAAKVDPGPGADDQTRLLNFSGRAV